MTDDDLGRHFYNYVNRGWPNKAWTWESLPDVSKEFYIQRAKKAKERYKDGTANYLQSGKATA